MTVAAGIEIAIGGRSEPGQVHGQGARKAQGAAWGAADSTSSASASASGAPSFRDRWQTLLASLNANGSSLIEQEPAGDGIEAEAESALPGFPEKATLPSSPRAVLVASTSIPQGAPLGNQPVSAPKQSLASKQPANSSRAAISTAPSHLATDSRSKSMNVASPDVSARSHRTASSERGQKQKASGAQAKPSQSFSTAGFASQAAVPTSSMEASIRVAAVPPVSHSSANLAASPATSLLEPFNLQSQLTAQDAPADSFRARGIQTADTSSNAGAAHVLDKTGWARAVSEAGVVRAAPPAGLNEAAEDTTAAEVHSPDIVSAKALPHDDLRASANETSEVAKPVDATAIQTAPLSPELPAGLGIGTTSLDTRKTDRVSREPVTTAASEVHPGTPNGFPASAEVTAQGSNLAVNRAKTASVEGSFNPIRRNVASGPRNRSSKQVAIEVGSPALSSRHSFDPLANSSVPLPARSVDGQHTAQNLVTSTGLQAPIRMRPPIDEALEPSSQPRIPAALPAGTPEIDSTAPSIAGDESAPNSAAYAAPFERTPSVQVSQIAEKPVAFPGDGDEAGIRPLRPGSAAAQIGQENDQPVMQIAGRAASADELTKPEIDQGSLQPVATAASEVNPAIPNGVPASVDGTAQASNLAANSAEPSSAGGTFTPSSRSVAAGSRVASSNKVAIGVANPASPARSPFDPPASPSVPLQSQSVNAQPAAGNHGPSTGPKRPAAPEALGQQNHTPLAGLQAQPANDWSQSPIRMGPQTDEPLEPSTQPRIPIASPAARLAAVASPITGDVTAPNLAAHAAVLSPPSQAVPVSPIAEKPAPSTSDGEKARVRPSRASKRATPIGEGDDRPVMQIAGRAADPNPQIRGLVGAIAPTTTAAAGDLPRSPASPVDREIFAALDSAATSSPSTQIDAGSQTAEAGFHDPDLGWVGVRADSTGGGVHASLIPDSASAAQALGSHVSGLNQYLVEQHTPVDTLTVAAPENRSINADQSGSQGMNQREGQNPGHGNYAEAPSNPQQNAPSVTAPPSSGEAAPAVGQDASSLAVGLEGRHISVMA